MAVETTTFIAPAPAEPATPAQPLLTHEAETFREAAARRELLLIQIRDGLRAVDARTANTFDGHAVRELLRIAEEGVDRG